MMKFPGSILWFLCLCLLLLLSFVDGYSIRNRTIEFKGTTTDDGPRRLEGVEGNLFFVKSENVSLVNFPGFHGVLERSIYLVDPTIFPFLDPSITDPDIAPYLPEYKYWSKDENLTEFIVRTVAGVGDIETFMGCPATQFVPFSVWNVNCSSNGLTIKDIATFDNVISLGPLPRIRRQSSPSSVSPSSPPNAPQNIVPLSQSWAGATILVSDTGLDLSHCAFYHASPTPIIRHIPGLTKPNGAIQGAHGTATAANAVGLECVAGIAGQAPGAPLIFCDLSYINQTNTEDLVVSSDFFVDCLSGNIQVHSASWGFVGEDGQVNDFTVMLDQYTYGNQYTIHFYAVGNDGNGQAGSPPSTGKSPLSIGAVDYSGKLASFTSNGNLADGRPSPLLYAPGVGVYVAYAFAYPPGSANHMDYAQGDGTSFATPFVAGIMLQEIASRYPTPVHASLGSSILFSQRQNIQFGYETLKTLRNYTYDLANGRNFTGIPVVFQLTKVHPGPPAKISIGLHWIEMPCMSGSTKCLLNNLDMYVLGVSDRIFKGEDKTLTNEVMDPTTWVSDALYVIVFTRDLPLIGQVSIGMSLISSVQWTATELNGSAICLPGDIITCPDGAGTKQCQTSNLTFQSNCTTCDPGYSKDPTNQTCICDPTLYLENNGDPVTKCGLSAAQGSNQLISGGESMRFTHLNHLPFIILAWILIK